MERQYVYEKLLNQHIRILKVVSNGQTFQAELEQFHVDHLPYFLALSWTWPKAENGERVPTVMFPCNGLAFTIPASLHRALSCLSPQWCPSSLRIWVDALCINQSDTSEKNVQVPLMSTIYGRANRVIVWLGDASHDSDLIMDERFMESVIKRLEPAEDIVGYYELPDLDLPDRLDNVWLAIGNLLMRRWFSRLWTFQEVVLAQEVDFFCGRHPVARERLTRFGNSIRDAGLQYLCLGGNRVEDNSTHGFNGLQAIEETRRQKPLHGLATLAIVSRSRMRDVEKPIDRVYGFLGILEESAREAVTVDYSEESQREYWRPYLQLGRYIVEHDIHHYILEEASSVDRPAGLPTWCPNLNSPFPELSLLTSVEGFKAGWSNSRPPQHNVKFAANTNNLEMPGFAIDRIEVLVVLGRPWEINPQEGQGSDGTAARWLAGEEKCFQLAQSACLDSDRALKAHLRTLIADHWESSTRILEEAWPTVLQAYHDLKRDLNDMKEGSGLADLDEPRARALTTLSLQLDQWSPRPYFLTKHGRLGRGAVNMRPGDEICVLYSGDTPIILRYEDGTNIAKLIGNAYLDGCMDLETMPNEGRGPDQIFTIG